MFDDVLMTHQLVLVVGEGGVGWVRGADVRNEAVGKNTSVLREGSKGEQGDGKGVQGKDGQVVRDDK